MGFNHVGGVGTYEEFKIHILNIGEGERNMGIVADW